MAEFHVQRLSQYDLRQKKDGTAYVATYCGLVGIAVDEIGGVIGILPAEHLGNVTAVKSGSAIGLRLFDSAAFSLSSDLVTQTEEAVEEDGEDLKEENARKKAKKASSAVKRGTASRGSA